MFQKQRLLNLVGAGLLLMLTINSCKSRYEKIRAGGDTALKYKTASYYFNKRDFTRALPLLEDLNKSMRGSDRAEDASYFYAYCEYYLKDFTIARTLFKDFAQQFPNSLRAEEARFMGAKCSYQESPTYSLDQENTIKAIDALQLFVNLYPHSKRLPECNQMIDQLHGKLETKSFQNARLYYQTGNFKPAMVALKNSLRDFPDSKYREDTEYLLIRSSYRYAEKSVIPRQEERYNDVIQAYATFAENFPNSAYSKEALKIKEDSQRGGKRAHKIIQEYTASITPEVKKNKSKDSLTKIKR